MTNNDNIYRAACPRKLDKWNSDAPTFTESAHVPTPEEKQAQLDRIDELIRVTKETLDHAND